MALIVSLDRGAMKLDLGDYEAVTLVGNEVHVPDEGNSVIARHIHNRWIPDKQHADSYMTLNIAGPLEVSARDGRDARLGPYYSFSMTDGILYVEGRVFGLWDAQNKDWYLKDTGAHCRRFRVSFHPTD